jgi:hypothetical protein
LVNFVAQKPQQMSFKRGDVIQVLNTESTWHVGILRTSSQYPITNQKLFFPPKLVRPFEASDNYKEKEPEGFEDEKREARNAAFRLAEQNTVNFELANEVIRINRENGELKQTMERLQKDLARAQAAMSVATSLLVQPAAKSTNIDPLGNQATDALDPPERGREGAEETESCQSCSTQ